MSNSAITHTEQLSFLEKVLSLGAKVKPGEGRNILLLMTSLFFLLVTAYLLKPVKEMLILTQGDSELRSYTIALQVVVLLFLLPIYGKLSRKVDSQKFMVTICAFFSINMILFYLFGENNEKTAMAFFIWLGAFGVLNVSQFWAFASQVYNRKNGERLFALVAFGASLGSWIGSVISRILVEYFSAYQIILFSVLPLLLSVIFGLAVNISNKESNENLKQDTQPSVSLLNGFSLILKSHYLILIALFVIVMNWCSSTGEYILAVVVETYFEQGVEAQKFTTSKEAYVGQFYSEFYFWVNLIGAFIQFFVVSRLIRKFGFNVAFVITPILIFMGYGLLAFLPIVSLFKVIKISENSLNYSLQNTAMQILYLPMSRQEKYEARAVIDTFCWKLGDLLQALSVFVGLNLLYLMPRHFVFLNLVLALSLVVLTYFIAKKYRILSHANP